MTTERSWSDFGSDDVFSYPDYPTIRPLTRVLKPYLDNGTPGQIYYFYIKTVEKEHINISLLEIRKTESFCLSMRYLWTVLNTCRLQTSPLFPSHKSLYHQRSAPCYSLWRTGTNEEPGWAGGPGADRNAAWRSRRRLTTKQNAS